MENVTFRTDTCRPGTLAADLHGEIDHHTAKPMREAIDREISARHPEVLTLSFRDVPLMDSSGIGLILGRAEAMKPYGTLQIWGMTGELLRLLRLCGMEKVPNITILT